MELNINVNIKGGFKIDLPAEILMALKVLTSGTIVPKEPTAAVPPAPPAAPRKRQKKEEPKPEKPEDAETSDLPFNEETAEELAMPPAEPATPEAPKKPTYTAEYIRSEFNKVRDRLEFGECAPGETKGANEKADPKIHKQLTNYFMQFSMELGNVKPTELVNLPNADELVPRFIERINDLIVDDGQVAIKPPF